MLDKPTIKKQMRSFRSMDLNLASLIPIHSGHSE